MKTKTDIQIEAVVRNRDGQRCRRCGSSEGVLVVHHRKMKSRGGKTTEANCVVLCHGPWGGNDCHGVVHSQIIEATQAGWITPSWRDEDQPLPGGEHLC